MFTETDEQFAYYYFELVDGMLSCYVKETFLGSRIGEELFGDPIDLKGYILQTPAEDRILLCEEAFEFTDKIIPEAKNEGEEDFEDGNQIQFIESEPRDYHKWLVAFKEHLSYRNGSKDTKLDTKVDQSIESEPVNPKYKYAEKTIEILRAQVRTAGKIPLEYLPLSELKAEIAQLFQMAQGGKDYDESRLDFLLMCMDQNPEHRAEKEEESRRWRENIHEYAMECLDIMRGFIPPHIQNVTAAQLEKEGMSKDLVKRLMSKKCLWLIRWATHDIGKLHIADLTGRYSYDAQGLDIVEHAAIYAVCPEKFMNDDASGSKEQWRVKLEEGLKKMYEEMKKGTLAKNKQRAIAYKGQQPFYTNLESYHSAIPLVRGDIDEKRQSFLDLKRRSVSAHRSASLIKPVF
jgi:hypothetical protein